MIRRARLLYGGIAGCAICAGVFSEGLLEIGKVAVASAVGAWRAPGAERCLAEHEGVLARPSGAI